MRSLNVEYLPLNIGQTLSIHVIIIFVPNFLVLCVHTDVQCHVFVFIATDAVLTDAQKKTKNKLEFMVKYGTC